MFALFGLHKILGWATGAFKDAALAPVNALADAIASALQALLKTLSTLWLTMPTPDVSTHGGTVEWLHGELAPWVGLLLVASLLIGAGRIMLIREPGEIHNLGRGIATYVLVAGTGTAVVGALISASDAFSETIVNHASQGNGFGKNLELLVAASGLSAPFLVIVLAGLAFCISLVQIALLLVRAGLMVVLVGVMPLAASMATTTMGRLWLRKLGGWLIAWVLYKPAAALVYATAFKLNSSNVFHGDGILRAITGVSLMGMAVVALPALLRFAVPATSHLAVGGGSGVAGVGALAASLPTGAKDVPPAPPAAAPAGAALAGAAMPVAAIATGAQAVHGVARSASHNAIGHNGHEGDNDE